MNKDKKIASKIRMRCRCTQFLMFFNINSQNLAYCSEVGERIKIIQTRKKKETQSSLFADDKLLRLHLKSLSEIS